MELAVSTPVITWSEDLLNHVRKQVNHNFEVVSINAGRNGMYQTISKQLESVSTNSKQKDRLTAFFQVLWVLKFNVDQQLKNHADNEKLIKIGYLLLESFGLLTRRSLVGILYSEFYHTLGQISQLKQKPLRSQWERNLAEYFSCGRLLPSQQHLDETNYLDLLNQGDTEAALKCLDSLIARPPKDQLLRYWQLERLRVLRLRQGKGEFQDYLSFIKTLELTAADRIQIEWQETLLSFPEDHDEFHLYRFLRIKNDPRWVERVMISYLLLRATKKPSTKFLSSIAYINRSRRKQTKPFRVLANITEKVEILFNSKCETNAKLRTVTEILEDISAFNNIEYEMYVLSALSRWMSLRGFNSMAENLERRIQSVTHRLKGVH